MPKKTYKLIIRPPNKMRYPTTGDYYKTKSGWTIVGADLKNHDYNFLTLIHEFVELYLTQKRGISEPIIKKFDEWFEKERDGGHFKKLSGPGWHPKAPYRREHLIACKVEKLLAKELEVNQLKQGKTEDKILKKIKNNFPSE